MTSPVISVRGLGKKYWIGSSGPRVDAFRDLLASRLSSFRGDRAQRRAEFWALKDLSFDVEQGAVLGIIGRNGAGKSTLLKVLSRITSPSTGSVRIKGVVASLLEVGTGFHGELTGRENVFLNGAILGMSRRDIVARFDEIVEFAGVREFLDVPVKRYSSGMSVRLAFAVAAHLEPEILIVDEVLAVGDADFQKKSLGKMQEVSGGGRTVLFVSHNMNAVEQLCTSALRLDAGHIVESGADVRGIIDRYLGHSDDSGAEWLNTDNRYTNEWFTPNRFWIGDESGTVHRMPALNSDELWVHIEGMILRPDEGLTIGYALFDAAGQLLYWTYQTDRGESARPRLETGSNHIAARIPDHLLNEGVYRVELIGGLHFRKWLFEPSVSSPSIRVEIRGGLSDSPYWIGKRPGVLAPVLEWRNLDARP